jgi:Family of unknown function (DUF6326)
VGTRTESRMSKEGSLDSSRVSVRARLATMWVVIMFFYLYNDVFMLLQAVRSGAGASAHPPSELKLLVYAMIITPAALMPLLCVVMKPALVRWVNILMGAAYFAVIVWTILPANTPWFYRYIGVVENGVTLALIWTAWRWPRREWVDMA